VGFYRKTSIFNLIFSQGCPLPVLLLRNTGLLLARELDERPGGSEPD